MKAAKKTRAKRETRPTVQEPAETMAAYWARRDAEILQDIMVLDIMIFSEAGLTGIYAMREDSF